MVKKIIGSKEALIDQFEIISFWNENNLSEKYGNKLRGLFKANQNSFKISLKLVCKQILRM